MSIHDVSVSAAETQAIIDEALGLRKKRQALTVREKEPDLKLVQPIPFLTCVVHASGDAGSKGGACTKPDSRLWRGQSQGTLTGGWRRVDYLLTRKK